MTTFEAPTDVHVPTETTELATATDTTHAHQPTPGPELLFGFFGDEEDKLWFAKGVGLGVCILGFFTLLVWVMGLHLVPTVLGH